MSAKPGFIFGGNTPWSYEELQRKRGIADQLLQANSRTPQNVGEGIAAIGRALASRSLGKKADKREGELRSEFSNDFNSKLGNILGGNASPSYASPGSFAPASPNQDIADDAMAVLGKPVQQNGGEWLQYSNQGATRNKPLNERLVSALSFLPEMGITMNVASGGQEAKGQGTRRTGSTRHDHGNAADADFYMDGRKLDWNNPSDIPVLQDIVKRARANGVTGFGAGDDYMGAGRMHIGFGDEAVWGANGKGENAPDWLRSAYYGAEPGGSFASGPGTQVAQGGGQGGGMQGILDIANLMSNPMATPGQKAVMSALLQQKMAAMQPQSEMEALQMQKLEAEIQQMQTPEPGFESVSPAEVESLGLPEGVYQRGPDGKVYQIGGSGQTINNNMPGGQKFDEAFAKGDAELLGSVAETGIAAQRNIGRIEQLESLLQESPSGFAGAAKLAAGEFGINTEGLSEVQAAQALINSLVPEQRQPGSGPMSDADLALFKQSLPRIINQPGGNAQIIQTMKAIAQYDAQGAQIVQQLRSGQIDRAQAFEALQSRANPLQGFKMPEGTAQPAPQEGQSDALSEDEQRWMEGN